MPPLSSFRINGIVPIIPTPFLQDEEIDHASLARLIEFAICAGANAVCLPAYASEFYKLTDEERCETVLTAIAQAAGRIPVIAQVNSASRRVALRTAVQFQELGASAVNIGVPRLFPLSERDLYRYFDEILQAVRLPVIIQDFNLSGPSITPDFIAALHRAHPHFLYVKLEEPRLGSKVKAIREATGGEVGVIEGWGGMYLMELVPAGVCGCMPGLALTDLLALVFRLLSEGRHGDAFKLFQGVLPQIVFSLQSMELFHHAEKLLLQARGLLPAAIVREATTALSERELAHAAFLNEAILALLDRAGLPRNPVPEPDSELTGPRP